jgi:hypothetical protein
VNLGACTLESDVDVQITVVDAMGDPVSSCDVTTDPYSAGFSRTCTFPVGNYTVTYTTDVDGDGTFGETGDVSCSFDIMILDEEAPVITCPDNQVFDTDTDECDATWTIDGTEVTVSDNCASPPSTQWTIQFPDGSTDSGSGLPGSQDFPAGVSEVTIDVTDGNFAGMGTPLGSATVTWGFDGEVVTSATSNGAIVTGNDATGGSGLTGPTFPGGYAPTPADAYSFEGWSTGGIDANDYFEFRITAPAGVDLEVTSIAFDERRSGTGIRDFEVQFNGTQVGTGSVPDNTSVRAQSFTFSEAVSAGTDGTIRIFGFNAEAGGGTWRIDNVVITVSGTMVSAMPASGNTTSCTFTVTVNDNQAPTVPCPSLTNPTLNCGDPLPPALAIGTNPGEIDATDNCTAQSDLILTVSDISNETSACDATNPLQIVRTYIIIDEANNSTECVQTFTYNVDDNNPVITGTPNEITVCDIAEVNSYDSVTELENDPGITSITDNASDDCGLDPVVTFSDAVAGNVITRTYTVYDQCGNTATVNQTITILQEVNISIDIPEFCDPAGADNLDVSEFTVITDGNGNQLTPQDGTPSGSGYSALFTGPNTPSISAAGVIEVPASVTPGIYDFTYTHIVNSGSTNCPQVENFSLIIVNEMTLSPAGSCLCNGSNNRAVELGDITGGQAPFTVSYTGGGLDTNNDGTAEDTDGQEVFATAAAFDGVSIILNDGEVSWEHYRGGCQSGCHGKPKRILCRIPGCAPVGPSG